MGGASMKSYFVENQGVQIHVLENGDPSPETPSLLVIGGLWEPAERAIPVLSGLGSHAVAISLRGRGLSSTPEDGYGLDDHLSDVAAVLKHCQLSDYCVLGFSRGAAYALGWTLRHQEHMRGLILVDQPPVHVGADAAYVEYWSNLVYLWVPILNFMRREALEGLARDAKTVDFTTALGRLTLPVALFAGRDAEARIPSSLSDEDIRCYQLSIPDCEVIEFSKSGHMIPDEEQEKYIEEIRRFLSKVG
jgi:pimeloyl-ACP methyl ester carboxylesterase